MEKLDPSSPTCIVCYEETKKDHSGLICPKNHHMCPYCSK